MFHCYQEKSTKADAHHQNLEKRAPGFLPNPEKVHP
jgi:hypothetical protein